MLWFWIPMIHIYIFYSFFSIPLENDENLEFQKGVVFTIVYWS